MIRIDRTLFTLLLVSFLWNFVESATLPAPREAHGVCTRIDVNNNYHYSPTHHPDIPGAELNSVFMQSCILGFVRAHRAQSGEEFLLIKDIIERLNTRMGALSHDREKVSCRRPPHFARFACEYYVFRLRHILI
jgi:hypothetical protein